MECKYCRKLIDQRKAYEILGDEAWHLDCGTANLPDVITTTYSDKKLLLDFLRAYLSVRSDPGTIGDVIERTLHANGYVHSLV